jgi:hypothetical protein
VPAKAAPFKTKNKESSLARRSESHARLLKLRHGTCCHTGRQWWARRISGREFAAFLGVNFVPQLPVAPVTKHSARCSGLQCCSARRCALCWMGTGLGQVVRCRGGGVGRGIWGVKLSRMISPRPQDLEAKEEKRKIHAPSRPGCHHGGALVPHLHPLQSTSNSPAGLESLVFRTPVEISGWILGAHCTNCPIATVQRARSRREALPRNYCARTTM